MRPARQATRAWPPSAAAMAFPGGRRVHRPCAWTRGTTAPQQATGPRRSHWLQRALGVPQSARCQTPATNPFLVLPCLSCLAKRVFSCRHARSLTPNLTSNAAATPGVSMTTAVPSSVVEGDRLSVVAAPAPLPRLQLPSLRLSAASFPEPKKSWHQLRLRLWH